MYASVQPLDVEAAAPTEKSSRRRGVLVWGLAAAAWCVAGVGLYRVAASVLLAQAWASTNLELSWEPLRT